MGIERVPFIIRRLVGENMSEDWREIYREYLFGNEFSIDNLEKGFRVKFENMPLFLYKFRGVDDFSLENLINGCVWLGNPRSMNDPYDCSHSFDVERVAHQQSYAEIIREAAESGLGNICEFQSMILHRNEEIIRELSNKVKNIFKFCSFSERLDSMLMWSHYADSHKGFCIEYDVGRYDFECSKNFHPIIYSERMFDATDLIAQPVTSSFNANRVHLAALYKAMDWQYEREWRLILTGRFDSPRSFKMPKSPSKVYLGSEISDQHEREIREICKKLNVPVKKMQHSAREFKMVPI
jgi:hypothetical protein